MGGAPMGELPTGDTTSFVEMPQLEVLDLLVDDESPLAYALRRRKHEIDLQEPTIAGHDSVI
jgi:hypothetical protein